MYDEIIKDIKSNLTGNDEDDFKYLRSQLEVYKFNEYGVEIVREISRMMYDVLPDDVKEEFIKINEEEVPEKDVLEDTQHLLEHNKRHEALELLKSFFKEGYVRFQNDKISEYHIFNNPLEEALYKEYIKTDKILRYIPEHIPLQDLFYTYGYLLFENLEFDEALKIFNYGLQINPVSTEFLYEIAEVYKYKLDFEQFKNYTMIAMKYSYTPVALARAYRNLGFYHIENNNYDIAIALYIHSLSIENNEEAFTELKFIESKGYDKDFDLKEIPELLKVYDIPIGYNEHIIENIRMLIVEFEEDDDLYALAFFYNLLLEMTGKQEYYDKLIELEKRINTINFN